MKNTVTASVEFYFKGVRHNPSVTLELDDYLQKGGNLPSVYLLIASANNIDMYSYEYEMMEAEPVSYSNASGLVSEFIVDGTLDQAAFEAAWHHQNLLSELEKIAQKNLPDADLSQQPALSQALLEAYLLGKGDT